MGTEDLWPHDFGETPTDTPLSILRTQASLLTERTKGLLEAVVRSRVVKTRGGERLTARFVLVVPALDHYEFLLLSVLYPVTIFPARITSHFDREAREVADVDELKEAIRNILGDVQTKRVLASLLAHGEQ